MESKKPQLIFIPGPGMGHIVAAVEVSKLLLTRDPNLSITFLLIKDPQIHNYIQSIQAQLAKSNLRFLDLPEAELPIDILSQLKLKSPPVIAFEKIQRHKPQVKDALVTILESKANIVGFIVDMFCTPMIHVAKQFNIPTYTFYTSSASFLSLKLHFQTLHDQNDLNVQELKDSDKELFVPGFLNHVPAKVLPTTLLDYIHGGLEAFLTTARSIRETKGVLVNTFQELELTAIESLSNMIDYKIPPVYPIGPIINPIKESGNDDNSGLIVSWLDNQPDHSVVFLCFGSQGSLCDAQIKQLAVALEGSGHRFLWSLKRHPPFNYTRPDQVLPDGFLTRCSGFGKVIGWAPQVSVLSHKAVGGFVSHCGWNSILESLKFGVPIAAWPMYAEQQVNAFQMVVELGMAVEIKMDYRDDDEIVVSSEEIQKGIMKLMEKDFNGIREKVKDMKGKGERALLEGGSSDKFLGCLIHDILKNSEKTKDPSG